MGARFSILAALLRGGIRVRLMVWGLGLIGTALGLNTIAGSIYTRRQIEQSTAALQTEIATLTARHIETFISRKIERLNDAATSMALYPVGGEGQKLLAHLLLKNDRSFTDVTILDDQGRERLKISERKTYLTADLVDQADTAAYRAAIQGQSFISQVYLTDLAEPYLLLAVPLNLSPQKSVAVLVAQTNLKFLWNVVRDKTFGRAGYVYLVNETGDLIAHHDSSLVLKHPNLTSLPKVRNFQGSRSVDRSPGARGRGVNGDEVLSTYAPIPELGWAVVVEEPVEHALADVERLSWYSKLLLAAGLLLGAVSMKWLSNKITTPILKLRESAKIIAMGDLNHRVDIDTSDEIAELGATFNQMAEALKISYDTLEEKIELRTREISALYDLTTTVNQTLVIDAVLDDVIKKITERLHFDTTRIFLFDANFEILTLKAYYNTVHAPAVGIGPFRNGQSVVGRVAQSGEPLYFNDIQTDPRYSAWSESKASQSVGFHFFAVLPIKTKTRIFGSAAFSGEGARQLNQEEMRMLNAMCEHVAVAVEKASLFEEVRTRSEDLAQVNQDLEAALRVKSQFISGMSHELRTPLNVIIGYAKMAAEGFFGAVNADQKDALDKISRNADILLKMVNSVLNLSRVEAKELSLELGSVDPAKLIAQIKAQVEPLNRNRRLEFVWDISGEIPHVTTDPLKLEEILQNLLGNAIKFTPAGKIEVCVRKLADQDRVEFSVADTGIGIEADDFGKIFNAFEQGKDAHTGNLDGVGLGLNIVKKYLDLMQGEIRVTSRVGQGSTFTFTIPHNLENSAQAAA